MTLVVHDLVSSPLLSCQLTYLVGWLTFGTPLLMMRCLARTSFLAGLTARSEMCRGPPEFLGIRWEPVVAP